MNKFENPYIFLKYDIEEILKTIEFKVIYFVAIVV